MDRSSPPTQNTCDAATPFVPQFSHAGAHRQSVSDLGDAIAEADCVLLVTDHAIYDADALAASAMRFVNARGPQPSREEIPA